MARCRRTSSLTAEGPRFIDINPRLVEPANAFVSGVDLTGALVEVARSGTAARQPPGNPGARTHQALLAILGVAADSGRRRDILRELLQALTRSGPYRHGIEELTPVRWPGTGVDPVTAIPAVAATLATLIRPAAWRHFAAGATSAYSLSPAAWQALLETAQQPEFTQAGCASSADLPAGGAVHMGGDVALVPVARRQRP